MYKFKDNVDGNHIFIIANNLLRASEKVKDMTSIPCTYISAEDLQTLNMQIVVYNTILPF